MRIVNSLWSYIWDSQIPYSFLYVIYKFFLDFIHALWNPKPETPNPNPKPDTLNLNPKPKTPNPNPKPSTLNPQP